MARKNVMATCLDCVHYGSVTDPEDCVCAAHGNNRILFPEETSCGDIRPFNDKDTEPDRRNPAAWAMRAEKY